MTDEPSVSVEGLCHRYRDAQALALSQVSFTVPRGEVFGVLGPNGGGKTTLFRILSTVLQPSAGQARIAGFDLASQPAEVRRRLGVVFQSPSLDKHLRVEENLRHHGHLYGLSGADLEARITDRLTRVGLLDRRRDAVKTLSGGQQRRVEIAKGLLHDPQVLLLDEPSTGLDPGARIDLWTYLDELSRGDDISILVTTHLMDEAERCDRLLILNEGQRVALGSPSELRAEIGGEVLSLRSRQAEELQAWVERELPGLSLRRFESALRIETEEGLALSQRIKAECPLADSIESLTLGRPTLEDVFIARTGHRFWSEESR